jgi:hypothetical protein
MPSIPVSRLRLWWLLFVFALGMLYTSVFVSTCANFLAYQKSTGTNLPFGIFITPEGGLFAQDFAYNMLFLRGIHEGFVARPYSMEGQVEMVRKLLPQAGSGMHHAYSPVAFALTLPLRYIPNLDAYLIYFLITLSAILLLTYFHLLPNAPHLLQIAALLVTLPSICTITALAVGQTALLTTPLLALFWILLRQRDPDGRHDLRIDLALALIFWSICFKPSVALVPFLLLVAAQSWRALLIGFGLLLVTWTLLAPYYGGWSTGLRDYLFLMSHYNHGRIPPFDAAGNLAYIESSDTAKTYASNRAMLAGSCAILLLLRWTRLVNLSELFQLLLWVFVLFSPYLLPSEDWILCLLIVEGTFFKSTNILAACGKLLLLASIFNIRSNIGLTAALNFPCCLILFLWLIIEMVRAKTVAPVVAA